MVKKEGGCPCLERKTMCLARANIDSRGDPFKGDLLGFARRCPRGTQWGASIGIQNYQMGPASHFRVPILRPNVILLLDAFFHVVIWRGRMSEEIEGVKCIRGGTQVEFGAFCPWVLWVIKDMKHIYSSTVLSALVEVGTKLRET